MRRVRRHHQDEVRAHQLRHHRQLARRVVGQLGIGRRGDADRTHLAQQQGVAIRRALGHGLRADLAAGAGAVVDHHRLPEQLAELEADGAGDDIRSGAGREADDQAHLAVGVGARLGERRQRQAGGEGQGEQVSAQHRWGLLESLSASGVDGSESASAGQRGCHPRGRHRRGGLSSSGMTPVAGPGP
jgi:hypothetical protein